MVAGALGWCMSISRIPQTLAPAIVAAIHEPIVFLLVSNLVLLAVGCFMEALAAMLILIPILVPAAISFGIDPVQFGLIMIFNLILGTIHPPIGVVLFVMARIADVTFEQISRAILPWLVPLLIVLLAITVWPPLTLVAAGPDDEQVARRTRCRDVGRARNSRRPVIQPRPKWPTMCPVGGAPKWGRIGLAGKRRKSCARTYTTDG